MASRERKVQAYKIRKPGSLVGAFTDLVRKAGGNKRAAGFCGVSESRMQQLTDPDRNEKIPVNFVMILERHCEEYLVTHFLAREANMVLVKLPSPNA